MDIQKKGERMYMKYWYILGSMVLVFALVVGLVLGFGGGTKAITNGEPDGDGHPYVGMVVFDVGGGPAWRCSGSLISPTVVVTCGHCTDGADAARVWFETDLTANPEYPFGGTTSVEGTPYTHPDFCMGCRQGLPGFAYHDVGVVVLDEPVIMDEYAELPEAGLVDTLRVMTDVELVGYGVQWQEGTGMSPYNRWRGTRMRHFAPAKLVASKHVQSDEFITITLNPAQGKGGSCFGDNGGPNILGGTNTVLAVSSYVTNPNCKGIGYSNRIDTPAALEFINSYME